MPGLQSQLQQGDRILNRVPGQKFGQLVRVQLSKDTKDLLDRVSKSSSRPFVGIVCAATQNYLQNPSYYRPGILKSEEDRSITISVRMSRRASDFFLNEAFVAPTSRRSHFIGLVVGIFLRRYPFKELVTALHAYADVLWPMLEETDHGELFSRIKRKKDP